MKELSIEEKAKRYDEAIEIINDYYQKTRYSSLSCASNDIEVLEKAFPELKESEGERIRRVLREIVLQWKNGHQAWCSDDKEIDTILAWLEKQGEQKPVWSEEDEDILNTIINHFKIDIECTDEDDIVRWLKSLKYRVQPKWEGSEEDEKMIRALVSMCDVWATSHQFYPKENKEMEALKTWLKSLRPQKQWKPSDNELEVLRLAAEKDGTCLMGLYEQLKKLK